MTDLGSSDLMVSLVQSATLLPLVLLAVPAGTLGDLIDRRRILLWCQGILILVNALFAYLVMIDAANVPLLLLFTLLNGAGAAFAGPLLSAIIPQLVCRENLSTAMSIGGISFNLSRAIGPIVGGYLLARFSLDLPFWIDAASFGAVVAVIWFWQDKRATADELPPQVFQLAVLDSVRFLRYTPALYNSVFRALCFFFGAGALWALMPVLAKDQLGGDATLYGYLLGAAGGGAVVSGLFYDRINAVFGGANRLVVIAGITMGVSLFGLGSAQQSVIAFVAATLAGVAWQLSFTSLITSTQYALPKWFGVRGMAYYFMAMGLSLAVGSALWGWLSDLTSIPVSFYAAAIMSGLLALLGRRFPLDQAADADLTAFTRYPQAAVVIDADEDPGGLILVRNCYQIPEGQIKTGIQKVRGLRNKRYRSGAVRWHLYQPTEDPTQLHESYSEVAWTVANRHDQRITKADEAAFRSFSDWLEDVGGSCRQEQFREV